VTYKYSLTEIKETIDKKNKPEEREAYGRELVELLVKVMPEAVEDPPPWENSGERIANLLIVNFLKDSLRELLGDRFESVVTATEKKIEDAARKEAQRIESEKKRLAAEAKEKERQARLRSLMLTQMRQQYRQSN